MVDFQSRDTRRGPVEDDEDEEPADGATEREDASGGSDEGNEDGGSDDGAAVEGSDEADADGGSDEGNENGGNEEVAAVQGTDEGMAGEGGDATTADGGAAGTASAADADATAASGGDGQANAGTGQETPDRSDEALATEGATTPADSGETGATTGDSSAGRNVSAAVVTISEDRTREDDPAGDAIEAALEADGHDLATREILRPTYDAVQQAIDSLVGRSDVDVVVTAGGTGVTRDDVTVEAVHPLIDKALPGFGELFRSHYYEEVGTDVVATRVTAGIADSTPVFCLPGDPTAARLGTGEIVVDQAPGLAATLDEDRSTED